MSDSAVSVARGRLSIIQQLGSVLKARKGKNWLRLLQCSSFYLSMSSTGGGRGLNKSLMNRVQVVDDGGRVESRWGGQRREIFNNRLIGPIPQWR